VTTCWRRSVSLRRSAPPSCSAAISENPPGFNRLPDLRIRSRRERASAGAAQLRRASGVGGAPLLTEMADRWRVAGVTVAEEPGTAGGLVALPNPVRVLGTHRTGPP
jgi:hypothetical protein